MAINRYPGPKPFKTEEQSIFFGRETDIAEFYKYIFLHQIIILFGESGYGKSSLINAGIIPLLKIKNPYTVCFEVKFGPYVSDSDRNTPLQKVKEVISQKSLQESPFLLDNYLETDQSFWSYLKNFQLAYEARQIIFFFDQFEELFTYPADLIIEFKKELADVLYSTVPEFYRHQEEHLDQIDVSEEFRMAFYQKPDVKVVFSIRSDRLSLLEDMKDFHPSVLKNCYELRALDTKSALEAIRKPASLPDKPRGTFKTVSFELEDKLSLAIVNSLKDKDQRVQPSTLQIICWQIEDKFVPVVDPEKSVDEVNQAYQLSFDEFDQNKDGNIKEEIAGIFDNYYRTAIETKVPEGLQNAAFLLVEKVLVQAGQRIPFEKDYLLTEFLMKQFKIASKSDSQIILDTLTDASLLKVERDSQGRMMYELGHDTLVEPISKAAGLRKEKEDQQRLLEEAENAKKIAQKAKEEEEKAKQQANEFRELKEIAEVAQAEAVTNAKQAYEAQMEAEEFARKAQYAQQKATLRSRVAVAVSVVAIIVAALAYYFKRDADESKAKAEGATLQFRKANIAATKAKNTAQANLTNFYILQAKGYIEKGDELVDRKAYQAAVDYYEAALQLPHQNSDLSRQIDAKISICKTSLMP